ncbi:tRNA (adenosine(37)-N6)-threonylcarbamoyltransferase complex ATPase subunit type 1 TsaE [Aurantivibrio infirmus]
MVSPTERETNQGSNAVGELSLTLQGEEETVVLGKKLGESANSGGVVFLQGQLGAGKTTFCRGVLRAFGHSAAVKSPTYTLVEPYEFAEGRSVFHFDLYRLGDPEELEYIGIRDYFSEQSLCLIEWPDRGEGFLPAADLIVKVTVVGSARKFLLTAYSEKGKTILGKMYTVQQ